MMFSEIMDRFVEQSAASVMFRGTLENVVTAELLDEMFVATAKRQRPGELLFSSIVDLLAMVAMRQSQIGQRCLSCQEGAVHRLDRVGLQQAQRSGDGSVSADGPPNGECGWPRWSSGWDRGELRLLRGYRTKIVDGNHLAATEHRIEELRTLGGGPLPGLAWWFWNRTGCW